MFFVLSGFLIVTLLLREKDRRGTIHLRDFYVRRSLRIFPIYYGLLLALALLMLTVRSGSAMARAFWGDLPYLATYTSNWVAVAVGNLAIVWSLATEEQFYLVWPSVERFLKPAAVLAVLGGVLAVNQLLNFGVLDRPIARHFGEGSLRLEIMDVTFTPIALGVLLAHLLHRRRGFEAMARLVGDRRSPLVLAAALLLACGLAPADLSGLPRLTIQLLMALWLASLVVREDHHARPLLTFGPVARIGAISYGMYLYHHWAMHPLRVLRLGGVLGAPLVQYALAVLLTVIVAELSYRLVEAPLLRRKRRFSGTPATG